MADEDEVDEFVRKATLVQKQVKALLSGELEPEDVKLPGEDSWAYTTAAARSGAAPADADAERARDRALQKKWDLERAQRLAAEENARWWKFARLQFGDDGITGAPPECAEKSGALGDGGGRHRPDGRTTAIDYSWWDKWTRDPDDPLTREEDARTAAEKEAAEMNAFEKANAGFCMSFKQDQLQREAADRKKAARAEALKVRGNEAVAAKNFPAALAAYHDALLLAPFNASILNNIAAAHIALADWPAAREFTTRTLFIEPPASPAVVKALFRRAHSLREEGKVEEAHADLARATKIDPSSKEIARDFRILSTEVAERAKEALFLSTSAPPASAGLAADGLPSAVAISEAVKLADMMPEQVIARCAARLVRVADCSLSGGDGASLLRDELRTASREVRAAAKLQTADEMRVLSRTSGLVASSIEFLKSVARAVTDALNRAPESPHTGGALAHMALFSSCAEFLAAACDNTKNRRLVRGNALASSALGAVLDVISLSDAASVTSWVAAFGKEAADKTAGSVEDWMPQLRGSCIMLVESFAAPSSEDPEGRAMLLEHVFFAPHRLSSSSFGIAELIEADIARLARYAPDCLTPGVLETLTGCANVLQSLCLLPPAPATKVAKAEAEAVSALHEVVERAVNALAAVEDEAAAHPVTVLLEGVTAVLGRALLDGEALLWSPSMVSLTGALTNLSQKPGMRPAFLAPARLPKGVPLLAAPTAPPPALFPLVQLLRLPLPSPTPPNWDSVRASALAAIANVCIEGISAVDIIASTGIVNIALLLLVQKPPLPGPLRGRVSIVLGRLAMSSAAASALTPEAVRQVVDLLKHSSRIASLSGMPQWARAASLDSEGSFQDGLLRLLAANADKHAETIISAHGVRPILSALKSALDTIPPLLPDQPSLKLRTIGAGNAVKILVSVASLPASHAELRESGACDELMRALQRPGQDDDQASVVLRKNAATTIARLMKNEECATYLRSLRVTEILITLSREGKI
jgi:tetratricopeptide (TPR) repeat protein